jgi:hypothetical protein
VCPSEHGSVCRFVAANDGHTEWLLRAHGVNLIVTLMD